MHYHFIVFAVITYRRGRTVKSGSEEIYMQDIVMKNKAVETEGEGGSISEEENEESAL